MRAAYDPKQLYALIPLVTGKLLDNAQVGTMRACMSRSTNGTANTASSFAHQLGRVPNGYISLGTQLGGVLYANATDISAWTASTITLRSTVAADTVNFLVW